MSMADHLLALALGFLLDLLLGDPAWLYHPVCAIGRYIAFMEKRLRRRGGNLRRSAVVLTASTVLLTMAVTAALLGLLSLWGRWPGLIGMAVMDWLGIAVTSMAREARGVEKALASGVAAGRKQVARIVGRDTQNLSEDDVIRATVETVAENTTDGVISPLLYGAIGGPVLLWGFKAASTLDSMVGYLDEKYRDIGWSSARLDDVLNYIPARITAVLFIVSAWLLGFDSRNAMRMMQRDAAKHPSPNGGYAEATVAGALHIRLGGINSYFGKKSFRAYMGEAIERTAPKHIMESIRMMYTATVLFLIFAYALLKCMGY